jgi:hypothetical protein
MQEKLSDILNNYGIAMERASSWAFGAPVSLLSHTRDEIKWAVKSSLTFLTQNDEKKRLLLRSSFINLALFIPDEDAAVSAKVQAALKSGDVRNLDLDQMKQALEILKRITGDQQTLMQEIDAFLAK